MSKISFEDFSAINKERCEIAFKHSLSEWSLAEWTNAMAGECGEACNIAKKILRGDQDVTIHDLMRELADVICYADLVASSAGEPLWPWVIIKFNEVSDRRQCDIKIPDRDQSKEPSGPWQRTYVPGVVEGTTDLAMLNQATGQIVRWHQLTWEMNNLREQVLIHRETIRDREIDLRYVEKQLSESCDKRRILDGQLAVLNKERDELKLKIDLLESGSGHSGD